MKRIVRLTEQDLTGLLKGIVNLAVGNLDNSNKKETTSNDDSKETTDNNDSKKNECNVSMFFFNDSKGTFFAMGPSMYSMIMTSLCASVKCL